MVAIPLEGGWVMMYMITGAGGQLGQALTTSLGSRALPLSRKDLDVTCYRQVQEALGNLRPHLVIHGAAMTDVLACEEDSRKAFAVNAVGTANIAYCSARLNIPVLYISTDYVFDGEASNPYFEWARPNPINVYGASKLLGEHMVRSLNHRHFIVRTAWVFGGGGLNFCRYIREKAVQNKEMQVVEEEWGSPTYAPDLAKSIVELLSRADYGLYHLVGQGVLSRLEMARKILVKMNKLHLLKSISRHDFNSKVQRPRYSPLISWRLPPLPPYEEGLEKFLFHLEKEQKA